MPAPVLSRERPLDDYNDRLFDELARVINTPGLPAAERVVVCSSPKVELMFILSGLASDWFFFPPRTSAGASTLKNAAVQSFSAFRGHHAVQALAQLRARGFWYDALPKLALTFADPPDMEQVYPFTDSLRMRAGGDDLVLRDLMARISDFATNAGFAQWWAEHVAEYEQVERSCRSSLAAVDPLGQLEDYFGETLSALVIIPSAMISGCGFGGAIEDPLGTWGIDCFGSATLAAPPQLSTLETMVYHEGGHSFVNHHSLEHPEAVARYGSLYEPISGEMERQAYGEWTTVLNEHVLRACHARIYLRTKGEASAEESLSQDETRGFRYVRALYAKLAEYEANRDRYPDFGSFYEELLTALDQFR